MFINRNNNYQGLLNKLYNDVGVEDLKIIKDYLNYKGGIFGLEDQLLRSELKSIPDKDFKWLLENVNYILLQLDCLELIDELRGEKRNPIIREKISRKPSKNRLFFLLSLLLVITGVILYIVYIDSNS